MLGIFDGIINQYFYVKTELYPAVQCVKPKILLLLVGMFFVKHERWLPIFYDRKVAVHKWRRNFLTIFDTPFPMSKCWPLFT